MTITIPIWLVWLLAFVAVCGVAAVAILIITIRRVLKNAWGDGRLFSK